MPRTKADRNAPFQSIRETCAITGLSQLFIRNGCKNGSIPHIMVGNDYRVNVPLFLEQLNQQSKNSLLRGDPD